MVVRASRAQEGDAGFRCRWSLFGRDARTTMARRSLRVAVGGSVNTGLPHQVKVMHSLGDALLTGSSLTGKLEARPHNRA